MQFSDQNNGGRGGSAFLLARNANDWPKPAQCNMHDNQTTEYGFGAPEIYFGAILGAPKVHYVIILGSLARPDTRRYVAFNVLIFATNMHCAAVSGLC